MDELYENQALEDQEIENGGQGVVVDTQEEREVEAPEGGAGVSAEETDNAGQERQKKQTHEDNAAARAARVRAEQETAERLQREYDDKIAGMGVVNPYTGKPIGSFKEFEGYGEQFRREKLELEAKKQGRPVEELEEEEENKSFLAQLKQREREQREAAGAALARQSFMVTDLGRFREEFPNVDVAKLEGNTKFKKFAGDRLYQKPLAELYRDFVELVSDTERAAVERAAGKQQRSTGGGQGGGGEMLTPEQSAALEEWNRENPEMKMTAKEFLSR